MLRIASVPFTRSSKRHAPVDLSAAQIGANEKGAPFSSKRTWVLVRCFVSRRRTTMKAGYIRTMTRSSTFPRPYVPRKAPVLRSASFAKDWAALPVSQDSFRL